MCTRPEPCRWVALEQKIGCWRTCQTAGEADLSDRTERRMVPGRKDNQTLKGF